MNEKLDKIGSDANPAFGRASFVQTELDVHEAWGALANGGPQHARAAALLHMMVARMDKQAALVASRDVLAEIASCSVSTIKRSLTILKKGNWIEIVQLGKGGGVNAYLINSRVAWRADRKLLPFAAFTASVVVSPGEQDYIPEDEETVQLRRIPTLYAGERQLPVGRGIEPPVQQGLPGVENDPPALRGDAHIDRETGEMSPAPDAGALRRLRGI